MRQEQTMGTSLEEHLKNELVATHVYTPIATNERLTPAKIQPLTFALTRNYN